MIHCFVMVQFVSSGKTCDYESLAFKMHKKCEKPKSSLFANKNPAYFVIYPTKQRNAIETYFSVKFSF